MDDHDEQQAADSQQEPQHDSGLQTPQPDQPIPPAPTNPPAEDGPDAPDAEGDGGSDDGDDAGDGSEDEGSDDGDPEGAASEEEPVFHDPAEGLAKDPYKPRRYEGSGRDPVAEHEAKQKELAEMREEHNRRVGDASRPSGSH